MQYLMFVLLFKKEALIKKDSVLLMIGALTSPQHLQYLILSHVSNISKTSSLKSLYFRLKERIEERS